MSLGELHTKDDELNEYRTDCAFGQGKISCTRCGWWHRALSVERAFALLRQHRRGEAGFLKCIPNTAYVPLELDY